jgi:hypothetical protein
MGENVRVVGVPAEVKLSESDYEDYVRRWHADARVSARCRTWPHGYWRRYRWSS